MNNSNMIPRRFLNWQTHRRAHAFIVAQVAAGRTVYITNALYSIRVNAKTVGMVKATKTGLYVQKRNRWECVNGSQITAN
jgi:hypothetical protein